MRIFWTFRFVVFHFSDFQGLHRGVSQIFIFKPVAKYWDRVSRPEQLMPALINAMRVLTDPANCGTAVVSLPQDVQGESFEFPDYFFQKRVHHIARRVADDYEIAQAVELIRSAKKPMLISGGGVRYSEAGETVMDFCSKFNIPVSQTQAGHSALPDSFELSVGGVGVTGGLAANALCKDCDLIIGVGTRFNDFVTGSKWVLFRNPDIKILAINTSEFHAEKLDAVRCVGDAKVTLSAIAAKLSEAGYKSGYTNEIQEIREIWEKERLSVLSVQYHGEGFGEGKFVPCVPSWTEKVENVVDDPIVRPSLNSFAAPHMPFEDCALDMTMPKAAARRVLGAKAYEKPGSIEPGFGLVR